MSPDELPAVHQSLLDEPTLDALFRDLELATELVSVTRKDGAERRIDPTPLDLGTARALLSEGRVRGVQIHYRFEGADWLDTLMPGPDGTRLVRIRTLTPR